MWKLLAGNASGGLASVTMWTIPRLSGAAAAAVLLLSGCVPTTAPATPFPTPRATPVFASEAEALAAATKAYAAYVRVSDEILADGGKNPERIETVSKRDARKSALEGFLKFRERGLASIGVSKIGPLFAQEYLPRSAGGIGVLTAYACLDVSGIDVLDSAGASVVSSARPDFQAYQLSFDFEAVKLKRFVLSVETPWDGSGVCPE